MSEEFLPYEYEALKPAENDDGEIRLLTLLPGSVGSHINCKLFRVSLAQPPKYEALSYTWGNPKSVDSTIPAVGNPTSTYSITLDGLHATITYNLEAALQQLRYAKFERILWVDALCIDQRNLSERNEQVKVMGKIYERAACVLAWLGEHDAYVDLAFDTLEQILWATKALIYQGCADWNGSTIDNITQDMLDLYIDSDYPMCGLSTSDSKCKSFTNDKQRVDRLLKTSGVETSTSMLTTSSKRRFIDPDARRLRDLLASIPVAFPAEPISLTKMATDTWGNTGSFAFRIMSNEFNFSAIPDWKERTDALSEVFSYRYYWRRLWVLQELALATNVAIVCGHRQVNLDMMYVIVRVYDTAGRLRPDLKSLFSNVGNQSADDLVLCIIHPATVLDVRTRRAEESLATMVQTHSNRLCSDPKDAIYALLNVSLPIDIEINYERPVDELYIMATKVMINFEQNLNIISTAAWLDASEDLDCLPYIGLPTWVPHFESILQPMEIYSYTYEYDKQHFGAGGNMKPSKDVLSTGDLRILAVDGGFYGEIEDAGSTVRASDHALADLVAVAIGTLRPEVWSRFFPRASFNGKMTIDGEVLRFLAMDVYQNPSTGFDKRMKHDAETRRSFISDVSVKKPPRKLLHCLEASLREKSICTTTTGHMALVLGNPRPGDRVFVARGSTGPLILRPASADETYDETRKKHSISTFYELVGGSYVHGIADGEVVEMMERGEVQEETVYLI